MASIFDSLAYDNSNIPDSVRRAAQGEADYQRAIRNKLPLSAEGSGLPESARKAAQAALERGASLNNITNGGYAEPAPTSNPWMQGQKVAPEGMFGKAVGTLGKYSGKALPGVGAVLAGQEGLESLNNKFGTGAWNNIQTAVEEGQTRQALQQDPDLANRGQETVNRISGNAMQGVSGLMPQYQPEAPQGLTEEELNAQNPADVMDAPQQSPMEEPPAQETPVGLVAKTDPATVPQAAAKTMQDQETQRQAIEQGAVKGLSTGAVSRPELAEEIVKADAQKSGVTLTPDQLKKATTDELTNMKSMDNNEVSRYISYALMAAGLLAVVLDDSGQAGDAFNASFNKQLDRNLQKGLATQKANAAAAKQAQDLQIALANIGIKQQVANTGAKAVDNTADYRDRSLTQRAEESEGRLGATYAGINAANARGAASRDLRIRQLDQTQRNFELEQAGKNVDRELRRDQYNSEVEYKKALTQQGRDRNVIAAARAAAQGSSEKGVDIPTKDAEGIVGSALESQGLNVSKPAQKAIAQKVRSASKNADPKFVQDPNGFILNEVQKQGSPYEQTPGGFFTDPTINQRKLK